VARAITAAIFGRNVKESHCYTEDFSAFDGVKFD
jgi:hypothetical protein